MKKILAVIMLLSILLSLTACGKSEAVKAAEAAIASIGEVTKDSGEKIATAEKLYGVLTDAEKAEVENRLMLVEAQETFEEIKSELIYNNAQEAYEKLKEVASLCVSGMDAIYGAWYWGIYNADDSFPDTYYYELSLEVPGFSMFELEEGGELIGFDPYESRDDWQYALYVVEAAIELRGDYATIENNMDEAEKILLSLTEEYGDYTYYPKLKEYYAAISSYVEFFTSPSGSFNQLADTINNYENNIRTLESDVGFLFK